MPYIDTLPSKSQVFSYWKDRLLTLRFFIDWGEPSCWACGFHYKTKYDIRRPDADWDTILRGWEKIPLQRCHIIPRDLRGPDTVDNLFLMCRECHDIAPNTSIRELFFEWARAQSWHVREHAKIRAAFESFGVEEKDYELYCTFMNSDGFNAWKSDKIGIHRPQSNYAPVSSRLTPSTWVGLLVFYVRQQAKAGKANDEQAAIPEMQDGAPCAAPPIRYVEQRLETLMDIKALRTYALSLPEVTEEPHFDKASFRVRGKIFVTVTPDQAYAHIFVAEQDRELAIAMYPEFVEKLMWGKKIAGIRVVLSKAKAAVVKNLVRKAWESKAPKSLLAKAAQDIYQS